MTVLVCYVSEFIPESIEQAWDKTLAFTVREIKRGYTDRLNRGNSLEQECEEEELKKLSWTAL